MKKRFTVTRACAIATAAALFVGCTAGCGKKKDEVGKVTDIEWFINMQQWDTSGDLWNTAEVLQEIVNKTGVKPDVTVPTGSGAEKVNLMLATGEMPDLLTFDATDTQINQMIKAKAMYPLQELIDKYNPDMNKWLPDWVKTFGAAPLDGVQYGLPSFLRAEWQVKERDDVSTVAFLVRSDVYEELGSPDMTTPDGFYNALVAFKEKYPEINGKKTIPLCLWNGMYGAGYLARSFGVKSFYIDEKGNYLPDYMDPKYEEFVKYMAKLNRAGLIDREAYIKKQDQVTEDLSQGLSFAACWNFDAFYDINKALGQQYNGARYKVIDPMNATDNPVTLKDLTLRGWTTTVVPKEAKHPEEAFKFMSYLFSREGHTLLMFGHEGEDWTRIDDHTIQRTDDYANRAKADDFKKKTGIGSYGLFYYAWDKCLPAPGVKQNVMETEDRPKANQYGGTDSLWISLMCPVQPDTDEASIENKANKIVSQAKASFMLEKDEAKALSTYHKMIDDVNALGYDKVVKYKTEQYNIAKQRYDEFLKKKNK